MKKRVCLIAILCLWTAAAVAQELYEAVKAGDLDKIREIVFNRTFLTRFELEDSLLATLRDDDLALLRFAFRWLRFALFAEPTMKVRDGAPSARRKA